MLVEAPVDLLAEPAGAHELFEEARGCLVGVTELAVDIGDQRSTPEEHARCFCHEDKECPRCNGSGFRPAKHYARCVEEAGSPSEGTDFPLVRNHRGEGLIYPVRCLPETRELDAV